MVITHDHQDINIAEKMSSNILKMIKAKQYNEAVIACQHLLDLYPDYHKGWELLFHVQFITKQTTAALITIEKLIKLTPDDFTVKIKKIKALQACFYIEKAKIFALTVYNGQTLDTEQCGVLGSCLSSLKLYKEALSLYQRLINLGHQQASLFYNAATMHRFLGNMTEAEQALTKAIELNPKDYEAIALRSDIITSKVDKNHINELKKLLLTNIAEPIDNVKIHYALAKELEDIGEYQQSFQCLKAGADLRRRYMQYRPENELKTLDKITQTFTGSWFNNVTNGTSTSSPIFIIGLPRTGTTLVERILGNHSQVTSAGELNHFAMKLVEQCQQENNTKKVASNDLVTQSQHINFDTLGKQYITSTKQLVPKEQLLIDKMPLNFLYAGLIHKALPNAKIIHLCRNPIDTCYAMYKKLFRTTYPFSYDLTETAEYYLAYRKLMAHWHQIMPGVIYDIHYENIVGDINTETSKLLDFCNLEWQEQCLHFHKNKSASSTASAAQVRQPIYSNSVAKWRNYQQELQPLIELLASEGVEL